MYPSKKCVRKLENISVYSFKIFISMNTTESQKQIIKRKVQKCFTQRQKIERIIKEKWREVRLKKMYLFIEIFLGSSSSSMKAVQGILLLNCIQPLTQSLIFFFFFLLLLCKQPLTYLYHPCQLQLNTITLII